jgi:OmcA/MtrC family decaheme c-type cytochrome
MQRTLVEISKVVLLASVLVVGACGDGKDGAAGPAGENGAKGETGEKGADGTDGKDGADGTKGTDGKDGTDGTKGTDGTNGSNGLNGENGGNVEITSKHGSAYLTSTGEYAACTPGVTRCDKKHVAVVITGSTADAAGKVTIDFTVKDADDAPVKGIVAADIDVSIVKLMAASGDLSFNQWVPYLVSSTEVVVDGAWPGKIGDKYDNPSREVPATLTETADGVYTAELATNISAITANGAAVTYDRSLTHRVAVWMGGHAGPTGAGTFDFVPDGSAVTETRNIVPTSTCTGCHGKDEFHGHGGDRITVEDCVMCHNYNYYGVYGKQSADFADMLHKIHAGYELASIPGADGKVFDDPGTPEDESADNGSYIYYRYFRNNVNEYSWDKVAFPAVIQNCQRCHQGGLSDEDNWKSKPSRHACGSCHDTVDWVTGTNHAAGAQLNDNTCAACHPASGSANAVTEAHDWTTKIERNIPEFDVSLNLSTPANGTHFVVGEAPVVTIVIKNKDTGAAIDHSAITKAAAAQGCSEEGPCPDPDNAFSGLKLMVNGPRALRNPVLTTAARVEVTSAAVEPWDLSAATDLQLILDGGRVLHGTDTSGGDTLITGTVTVAVSEGTFADASAATAAEVVAWLNGNADFKARAIAWAETDNKVSIRSRNLGTFYSLQLVTSDVATAIFAGDTAVKVVGGYYPYADLRTIGGDPKATFNAGSITYQLDPVDDLKAGTYIASVEIADVGRASGEDYQTPSIAITPFQVGTATEEMGPAGNCASCHQGPDGRGFILDFARHYKVFNDTAIDQCGGCHDYQSQKDTGIWAGGKPMSRRIHAIHYGSSLNYPLGTVDYGNGDHGRNWDITLPLDVRNCEVCHTADKNSDSWKTEASRLPCSGCHDSDANAAHFKIMTWDPTPTSPWNGDEEESCKTCH